MHVKIAHELAHNLFFSTPLEDTRREAESTDYNQGRGSSIEAEAWDKAFQWFLPEIPSA